MNPPHGQGQSRREIDQAVRAAAMSTIRDAIERAAAQASPEPAREEPGDRRHGGQPVRGDSVDALAGVSAALLAAHVARRLLRDYALDARAAGRSWDDVAAALELPNRTSTELADAHDVPRAETAFEWLIEGQQPPRPHESHEQSWQRSMASWRCSTCRNRVIDHGPFESHPDDREYGHAADCPRRTAALEAWRRESDDDSHEHTDEQDDHEQDHENERDEQGEDDGGGGRR